MKRKRCIGNNWSCAVAHFTSNTQVERPALMDLFEVLHCRPRLIVVVAMSAVIQLYRDHKSSRGTRILHQNGSGLLEGLATFTLQIQEKRLLLFRMLSAIVMGGAGDGCLGIEPTAMSIRGKFSLSMPSKFSIKYFLNILSLIVKKM